MGLSIPISFCPSFFPKIFPFNLSSIAVDAVEYTCDVSDACVFLMIYLGFDETIYYISSLGGGALCDTGFLRSHPI
jgi:hypothetical protein